jgi:hypothetical protein
MSTKNKRQKIDDKYLTSTMITKFEQLPNELILLCFSYFTFYELYETFFCLNQRLNQLLLSKASIYINLNNSIIETSFLTFCYKLHDYLRQSKNDFLAMTSYNEIRFNIIMKDDLFQDKFAKLKSLALHDIHADSIYNAIFDQRLNLYERLERLILHEVSEEEEHGSDVNRTKIVFM